MNKIKVLFTILRHFAIYNETFTLKALKMHQPSAARQLTYKTLFISLTLFSNRTLILASRVFSWPWSFFRALKVSK